MHSRWPRLDGLAYGGEYNPEQWPAEVWEQDVALMREAGVTLVSVGIFSWGMLEPRPGQYEFGWLDRVLGLLHEAGIAVDLGTPTAAPPPWFLRLHPQARPVTREGLILGGGSRQAYCPSSPDYAQAAAGITRQLALRYGRHPAVVLWHVNNEYGAPLGECYCEVSAAAFRDWLRARYGDLAALNEHWGAAFWSQRYAEWDEIDAPRASTSVVNPGQRLDFARFSSDALLDCFKRERDILREVSPAVPVTTNFMANNCKSVDYWRWAAEVDVISNDNYLIAERTDSYLDLAMSADLTRSLADGGPWLLMEHSTSAVSWQPRNVAKRPGEMRRNSLAHVARGADGRAVLPVAGRPVRRREAPLGDAAAGGHRHPGLARGRRPRPRTGRPGRAARQPGRGGHRADLGLGIVVGAGARVAAQRGPRIPGAGPRLVRGVLAGRADGRLRAPPRPISAGTDWWSCRRST